MRSKELFPLALSPCYDTAGKVWAACVFSVPRSLGSFTIWLLVLTLLTPIAVAFETTPSNYNMLVYFFCTLFQFVCCIKCNAGGRRPAGIAFYAADKLKKRAEKVNKHIII